MRTFKEELYEAMCAAFPNTTVRSISRAMGMSDGYWSSVAAQGLNVSNAGLLHLMDYLECKKITLETFSASGQAVGKIQEQITAELLGRLDLSADTSVPTENAGFNSNGLQSTAIDQPLPFVISTNGYYSR